MVQHYLIQNKLFVSLRFITRWKFWLSWVVPFACLPLLSITKMTPEGRCAYILLVVGLYWVLNLIPLPMSSLMPFFLCPMLGVLSSDQVTKGYLQEISVLLLGGMAAAIAIEECNLHHRIALRVLIALGTKPRWLLLGFMVSTSFLSMWINNTSACAMMLPIAESVLAEMFPPKEDLEEAGIFEPEHEDLRQKENMAMRRMILISISICSNLGGTGTVTGTGPNVILLGVLVQHFGDEFYISYLQWMAFAVPILIISVAISWIMLQVFFLGFTAAFTKGEMSEAAVRLVPLLRQKYDALGKMSFHEKMVLYLFVALVMLWMTRDPRLTRDWEYGWKFLFYEQKPIRDSAAAMFIVVFMCMFPSVPYRLFHQLHDRTLDAQPPPVLSWSEVQKKLGWGVLLIMGGGLSMSDACKESGLSHWIAARLDNVREKLPLPLLLVFCLIIVLFMTTVTSNTATAAIMQPVLASVASGMSVNPIYFMLPAAITCSYSFILPISTPPNTMVFDRGGLRVYDMALSGAVLAVILIALLILEMEVYAPLVFDMSQNATVIG